MASGLHLTLLAGPVVAVPVPKPVTDALTSVEVTVSDTGASGFQLTFTLADRSILQTLFLLSAGAPIPMLRVILMATTGAIPQVLIDGVITHQEVSPDAMTGSSTITVTGEDLTAMMNQIDLSGVPYPGMSADVRVATILAKYAAFGVIPEVFPVFAPDIPIPTDKIPTQKGTDLAYIRQLASENGYVFYIDPGPLPGISKAYWGPQVKVGLPQPALNVNLDSWTNVESLSFRYDANRVLSGAEFESHHPDSDPGGESPESTAGHGGTCSNNVRTTEGHGESPAAASLDARYRARDRDGRRGHRRWPARRDALRANFERTPVGGRARGRPGL
jgi:hypothetical protein